ncbi:MAG TPA: serine/threonine-protein kinase [Kofleriaceae bacterium]|nr:serine/threonine-protein kinase [Kofleriaceae bacterium]
MISGEPKVGDVLDSRYRITGVLGSGGMGSVYRAEHVTIRRPVAIKVLHPDFAEDPDYAKRFEREAFVTGRTDHPNCVTVSDFGPLDGGGFYLVMELVDGVLLADLLDDEERLPARRALSITRHILRGLGHAHAAGIVHRDVKPANVILLKQDGDEDFAKILDFGIAKLVDAAAVHDPANNQLTRIGTTVGTPTYVAPEQAVGGAIDARADLYSVSIMLYEMVAGLPPFQADETVKVLAMHLSAPVPPIAQRAPGVHVSPAVEQAIVKGLAKDRADRYASAADFIAAIDDLFARGLVDLPASMMVAMPGAPMPPPPVSHAQASDPRLTPLPGSMATPLPGTLTPVPGSLTTSMTGMTAVTDPSMQMAAGGRLRRRAIIAGGAGAAALVVVIALAAGSGGKKHDGGASGGDTAASVAAEAKRNGERDALWKQVDALLDRKKPEQAIALMKKQVGDAEDDPVAQLLYGHAYIADGRATEGLKAYSRTIILNKKLAMNSDRMRRYTEALLGSKNNEAALAALDLLAELDDDAAREKIALVAGTDQRNVLRHRARELAQSEGVGDKVDKLTSYVLDLLHEESCEERAKALPVLRELGDKRAIPALERARGRRRGGFLGFGAHNINKCMNAQLDEAIAELESK